MADYPIEAFEIFLEQVRSGAPLGVSSNPRDFVQPISGGAPMYENENEQLNISFRVERLAFPDIKTMDPRVVRIPPSKNNERHRHAHESLFVVLQGEGEVLVGETWVPIKAGEVAFIPRWIFHQSRNTSKSEDLVLLAITDFGLAASILGNYDRRQRLAQGGADAVMETNSEGVS